MAFNLGDIFVKFKATSEGFEKVVSTIKGATDKASSLADTMGSWGDKAEKTGKKMTLSLTTPIVGFGAAAFKLSADFDTSMRQVQAATNAPAESMKSLSDLATKMGADTVFSANDAAQAMLELAKGGLNQAQIQAGALAATMTLAAAGGLDLASAAQYISNALNTFGMDASKANQVAAALAGGANASSASVESLGLALSQVGPGAKLAGYSLQETVAVLAAFDNAGVKGSDAGTSLKTMLMNLTPQTQGAADEMKKLGLKFTDAKGRFLPLRDVAQKLKDGLKNLTDEQKTNALTTMFGTDAYRAAAILMEQGADGVDKYTQATSDQTAAQKMADAAMGGSNGKWEAMKGSLETLTKTLGDLLAPSIQKVMDKITGFANKVAEMSPHVQKIALAILAVTAATGPFLIVLGKLGQGVKTAKDGIEMGTKALKLFSSGFMGAVKMIGSGISFLAANPMILVVIGIILLIAGLAYLIYRNWDTLKQWFNTFINWMVTAWQWLWDQIRGPVMFFVNLVVGYIMALWMFWSTIIGMFWTVVKVVFDIIVGIVAVAISIIVGIFNLLWPPIKFVFDIIWGIVKFVFDLISAYIGAAISFWGAIIGTIIDVVKFVFNKAVDIIKGIWGGLSKVFGNVWDGIKSGAGAIVDIVSGPFKKAFNMIAHLWNSTVGKLDFHAPDWVPGIGGKGFSMPKLPELAEGGVLMPRRGGVPFIGAEAGSPEAVIPLKKLPEIARQMGVSGEQNGGNVINISGAFARNESELTDLFEKALESVDRRRRAQGRPTIMGA